MILSKDKELKIENLNLLFMEGPISRSYISILNKNQNYKPKVILYLKQNSLPNFLNMYFDFKKNNYYPLKFLKDKNIHFLISQIEEYFDFDKGLITSFYKYDNLKNFNKTYIKSNSINSEKSIQLLNNLEHDSNLITTKEILKENLLNTKNKFYHIHPGYLPVFRGADCSLHSILNSKEVGSTFFKISKQIDQGEIKDRIKKNFFKFRLKNLESYQPLDLYRIWFSFFDNSLRAYHFNKLLNSNIKNTLTTKETEEDNKYFTFLDKKNLKEVFNHVFYDSK